MKTVLVVDDERDIREGLRRLLVTEGYRILTAEHGREALDILDAEPVDVVLCDLKMPVMGATGVLEKVGASCPSLPVIVLTGQGTVANVTECMKKGAYDFVTKPFRTGDVISTVKCAMERLPPPQKR